MTVQNKFLFPVGRLVGGSLYKPEPVTNSDGTPKLGADGKQRSSYSFAVAYPKVAGVDWKQTEWGQKVYAIGVDGFPNGEYQAPSFAWKVVDGDSTIPNKKGKKPVDREGYKGNWVVWFSSEAQAPRLTDKDGTREGTMAYNAENAIDRIKPGHYVEVLAFVKHNKPSPSPGVYMNYDMVAHTAVGAEIELRALTDSTQVGFGRSAAPTQAQPVPQGAPQQMQQVAPPVSQVAAPQAAPAANQTVVQPNAGFLAGPPSAPPAPPAAPQRRWLATDGTYEQYIAAGWTDAQLIEHQKLAA